jgi:pilus assembly protein Flp/PilA
MKNMIEMLANLHNEEEGQDLIEYALIAALLATAATATMTTLAGVINGAWTSIGTKITNALGTGG